MAFDPREIFEEFCTSTRYERAGHITNILREESRGERPSRAPMFIRSGWRVVDRRADLERWAAHGRVWKRLNPGRYKEANKRWRKGNGRKKTLGYKRAWYQRHRAKLLAKQKAWRTANRAEYLARMKRYNANRRKRRRGSKR